MTAVETQVSETITRKSASNLALAFVLLPPEKRRGMSALYAFCREIDDIADDEGMPVDKRRVELQAWREDIAVACAGHKPEFPVNREITNRALTPKSWMTARSGSARSANAFAASIANAIQPSPKLAACRRSKAIPSRLPFEL